MIAPRAWKSRGGKGFGSAPFLVAGIVNITPDSFSDGGRHYAPEEAMVWCRSIIKEGAAILDLGGESTRPGSTPVNAATELARLEPTIVACVALRDAATKHNFHVAVDTWRAATAIAALEAGVDIINDISGSSFDPAMPEVLGNYKPGYVLMHCPAPPKTMQKKTDYSRHGSVVDGVLHFFEKTMAKLVAAGLPEENIILDPGIGFGKTAEQNVELLRNIPRLHSLGRPLYVGISRKSMFGDLLQLPVDNRDAATQVVTALLADKGVYVHRVHDVTGAMRALELARLLRQ
ncbi:Dihydropteroate synthase [uncultured delta proteobacterium]|uniref:Dihydropteroate synthase n=1 Tax=uncultured delta proteobacterium TaxID=34034 RepID=A0A212ITT8_9DELT|nr:Dihydropteroate synthase [uncultured delta proteobacterium]